jgi:hypothetical protein
MLSEALQRNAEHDARVSNISGYRAYQRTNQRFFTSFRMTMPFSVVVLQRNEQ